MPRAARFRPAFASASVISAGVPRTTTLQILRSTQEHAAMMTRGSMPSGSTTVPSSFEAFSMISLIAFILRVGQLESWGVGRLLREDLHGVAGDHELLVGRNDYDGDLRAFGGNDELPAANLVRLLVELDAERAETVHYAFADLGRVLPDAAGQDDRVRAADSRVVRADVERHAIGQHLERELGRLVARVRLRTKVAAVARTCESEEARLLVENRVHLGRAQLFGLHDREDCSRVDVAAARAHHEAGEGRQAHRGVYDAAVLDRGERGAVAEVAGDEVHLRERLLQELRSRLGDELVARAVEAVLADAVLLVVLRVDRVHAGAVGHRRDVECGVEDGDVRNALEDLLAGLDAAQVGGHVQGTELHELLHLEHVGLVHERGIGEDLGAVQHPVSDRIDALGLVAELGDDALERLGVRRGPAAADALADALRETGLRRHVEKLILEGAGSGIDDEYFSDCLFHYVALSYCSRVTLKNPLDRSTSSPRLTVTSFESRPRTTFSAVVLICQFSARVSRYQTLQVTVSVSAAENV